MSIVITNFDMLTWAVSILIIKVYYLLSYYYFSRFVWSDSFLIISCYLYFFSFFLSLLLALNGNRNNLRRQSKRDSKVNLLKSKSSSNGFEASSQATSGSKSANQLNEGRRSFHFAQGKFYFLLNSIIPSSDQFQIQNSDLT